MQKLNVQIKTKTKKMNFMDIKCKTQSVSHGAASRAEMIQTNQSSSVFIITITAREITERDHVINN